MFKKKIKPIPEFAINTLKIIPNWNGKFSIVKYVYLEYLNEYRWSSVNDIYTDTIYFDTKKEAIKRINFMGFKYND